MTDNLPVPGGFQQQDLDDIAGQIAPRSQRIYRNDAKVFAQWIMERGLTPGMLTRSDVIAYRAFLGGKYSKASAQRMFSVARRLLAEQVNNQHRADNPSEGVPGFKGSNETPHRALKKQEAKALLAAIDTSTKLGRRDYALILLLLRTGIRRSECVALNRGDIKQEQGHFIAVIEHGKGDKRRVVKLPVDVFRVIDAYIKESGGQVADMPLFVRFYRGDNPSEKRMSDKAVEGMVIHCGKAIQIDDLTPHGLRASFITLALEGGAMLQQVQYASGHADPRTTERYQKRKLNLDDNAVDYIKL